MEHKGIMEGDLVNIGHRSTPKVIPMTEEDEGNVKILDSVEEFNFTYTHSDMSNEDDLHSEYVGFEARKHGAYRSSDEEREVSVAQEQPYLGLSPSYGER